MKDESEQRKRQWKLENQEIQKHFGSHSIPYHKRVVDRKRKLEILKRLKS